jgi:hypothetical protein
MLMTAYLFANHLLNFVAPAAFVAAFVVATSALTPRFFGAARSGKGGWRRQLVVGFALNLCILVTGLVVFRQDGKLLTYAALVAVAASAQWAMLRGPKA